MLQRIGQTRYHFAETPSTNDLARELLSRGEATEGTLITATRQTAGRGQRGRHWHSEGGAGLTCSIILVPTFLKAKDQFGISAAVALAVHGTVSAFIGQQADIRIKWPNDIYADSLKLGGILIENGLQGDRLAHSIVGIGLNVNNGTFPEGINAASLRTIAGIAFDMDGVASKLCEEMDFRYAMLRMGKDRLLLGDLNRVLYKKGEATELRVDGHRQSVTVIGATASGLLCVRMQDGQTAELAHHRVEWL